MQDKIGLAVFAVVMLAAFATVASVTGNFDVGFALGVGSGLMLALLLGAAVS